MKIIALLPFKNEERFLPSFLSTVKPAVDQIIAIDDNSTDNSVKILEDAGVYVYKNDIEVDAGWAELGIREKLLRLGRENSGTHFAVMDADEAFTGQFPSKCREICEKLSPGQKIKMQWLAMWKSVDHYRDDNSVWSNNYKDFIFCDDGKTTYPNVWMHTPRTPGPTTEENCLTLNPKYGAVLHFQFSEWEEFQIKQAWYRCSEFLKENGRNAPNINNKYRITVDDPNATVTALPDYWKQDVVFPNFTDSSKNYHKNWRLRQIEEWFKTYGKDYFKPLEIWNVSTIKSLT